MAFCFAQTDAIECAFGDKLILVASCSSRQHRQSVQTGEGCSNMPARGKATPRHAMHTQCQHAATACSMYAVPAVLIGASTRSHAHTLTRPLARRTCVGQPAATACRPWRECIAGNVVGSQLLRQHLRVVVHPSLGSGVERSAVCGMACCGGNIHNLADLALPHSCNSICVSSMSHEHKHATISHGQTGAGDLTMIYTPTATALQIRTVDMRFDPCRQRRMQCTPQRFTH
jgi:hypothetical protein